MTKAIVKKKKSLKMLVAQLHSKIYSAGSWYGLLQLLSNTCWPNILDAKKTQAKISRETNNPMLNSVFTINMVALYVMYTSLLLQKVCEITKDNLHSHRQNVPWGIWAQKLFCNLLDSLFCNFVMTLLPLPSLATTNWTLFASPTGIDAPTWL